MTYNEECFKSLLKNYGINLTNVRPYTFKFKVGGTIFILAFSRYSTKLYFANYYRKPYMTIKDEIGMGYFEKFIQDFQQPIEE